MLQYKAMKRQKAKTRSPLRIKPLRLPAQSLREEIIRVGEDEWDSTSGMIVLSWVLTGLLWYIYLSKTPLWIILFFLSLFTPILTAYGIYKMVRIRKKLQRLKLGRDGELIVAEHLEVLREEGCYIIHDFIGEDFNIDHIVVAPQGIFCIETKTMSKPTDKDLKIDYYGDSIKVAGKELKSDVLRQVQAQANYLKNYLNESLGEDIFIRPVVAYPGWFINLKAKKPHIWVLEPKAIPKFMRHEPTRLDNSKINMIKQALRINVQKN